MSLVFEDSEVELMYYVYKKKTIVKRYFALDFF